MKLLSVFFLLLSLNISLAYAQAPSDSDYQITLPIHPGRLQWHAEGFQVIESSAKPNDQEIGLRGKDTSGRFTFLGFLFVVAEEQHLTGAKCRDGVLDPKSNPGMTILGTSEISRKGDLPVEIVTYSEKSAAGKVLYSQRGFVADGNLCGDLEFYSDTPINAEEPELKKIFGTYRLDSSYAPKFDDIFVYAQILYRQMQYKAAGPLFELALTKMTSGKEQETMRRVATDQAGMAYGISGDIGKARSIFQQAIAKDPDYPLYYYNLACADAQENKLGDARVHLQQAFARKANVIQGEAMPDPAKDDSFLPHQNDKDFWTFVQSLH